MNVKIKQYCSVCDCNVVPEGHDLRCRPKTDKSWNDERVSAWFGDMVQKLDIQLVLKFLDVPKEQWGEKFAHYTSNESMANYLRTLGVVLLRSDHTLGTAFEARYCGMFREVYLKTLFPTVYVQVLSAWQPPSFQEGVTTFFDIGL